MRIRSRGQHRRRFGRPFARLWVGFTLASSGDGFAYGAVPLLAVVGESASTGRLLCHRRGQPSLAAAGATGRRVRGPVPARSCHGPLEHLACCRDPGRRGPGGDRPHHSGTADHRRADQRWSTGDLLLVAASHGARARQERRPRTRQRRLDGYRSGHGVPGGSGGRDISVRREPVGAVRRRRVALISSCIPFVKLPSKAPAAPETSNSIWEGVRLLFADRRLRVLVLMVAALALFQGMEGGVLVLLATTEWGVREGAYGLFLASTAVGNLLGSALADGQVRRFGSARTLIGAAVLSGVGYLIMASAHSWVVAAPAFALVGVAVSVITVVAISLRQRLTPPHLMGRVGSAWRGLVWGAAPVGALVAGSVATIGGLRLPLLLAGALQCAVAIVFARPLLRSTRVDTPPPGPRGGDGSVVDVHATAHGPTPYHVDPHDRHRHRPPGRPRARAGEHVAGLHRGGRPGRRHGRAGPAPHPGRRDRGAPRPDAAAAVGRRRVGRRPRPGRGGLHR